MATLSTPLETNQQSAQTGFPPATRTFETVYALLSVLFVAGLMVDGWAHFHGQVDNTFFTPWHALFYSSYGVIALFVGANVYRNVSKGYRFTHALPRGYGQALIGVVVFGFGGAFDMLWHTLFGIEQATEALLSPSHQVLAVGMALITIAPLRAALSRPADEMHGWRGLLPAALSVTLGLTLVRFFTGYANPILLPLAANVPNFRFLRTPFTSGDVGVTAMLLEAAFISANLLLLARRWRMPFGMYTLIMTLSTAPLTLMNDAYFFTLSAAAAGLLIDLIALWLQPSARDWGYRVFAFAAPFTYYAVYLLVLALTAGVAWRIHVWTGALTLTGAVGLLLSYFADAIHRPRR